MHIVSGFLFIQSTLEKQLMAKDEWIAQHSVGIIKM